MNYPRYNWEKFASEFNTPYSRNICITTGFSKYPALFGLPVVVLGCVSRKNEIEYVADMSTWKAIHERFKERIEENPKTLEKLIDKTERLGKSFNHWTESNIFNVNLTKLNNKSLIKLLNEFIEKQSDLYCYGVLLPVLDFGHLAYVEENLKNILKNKLKSEKDYHKAFQLFTEPLHNSFAQDQEEDLLRLMKKFFGKEWADDIKNKNLQEIKELYPKFFKWLEKHTKKYCWVYYVFAGPAYKEEDFLNFIRDYLNSGVDPEKRLAEFGEKRKRINTSKKQYLKKIKPDKKELFFLNLAAKVVWAKPRRKDYQSRGYYHLEKLQLEIERRLYLSLNQVRSTPVKILEKALETGKIDENIPNSIYKFYIIFSDKSGKIWFLYGKEAEEFYEENLKRLEEKNNKKEVKEIVGNTAYPGKVKGKVKIINKASDMVKMQSGDILVSYATNPSLVLAMKKAGAIVADEGGLTCHASIVSRELETPCVVGTKNASKILKDGDEVEVNADNGTVKILKRAN